MELYELQNSLKINNGTFNEEVVEQTMVHKYLDPNSTVLELGSNIGRNSLIISSILYDSSKLVTLEMDTIFSQKCEENKKLNNLNFHIINSALSYRPLYFQKNKKHGEGGGYCVDTKYNNDYYECPTITFEEIEKKYNLKFDTLVIDCEGGFYHILKDNPNILSNIKLLIIENDFPVIEHKNYLNELLVKNGFKRVFVEKLISESNFPCKDFFWETWTK
jgi:FkbM family methyltransferase